MTKRRTEAAVAMIITDDQGRVLLSQRSSPVAKGIWHLAGGGPEAEIGENHLDALVREAREELGIEIRVGRKPVAVTSVNFPAFSRHVMCAYFAAQIVSGEPQPLDGTEAVAWCSRNDTQALIDAGVFLEVCIEALNDYLDWRLTPSAKPLADKP